MKKLKTYADFIKESTQETSQELLSIYDSILKEFPDCEISLDRKQPNLIEFSMDCGAIEPEVGSYTEKSEFFIKIGKKLENYTVDLSGISGQYGCDEPDEDDMDIEPEMDYSIESTNIDVKEMFKSPKEVVDFIVEQVKSYI